MKQLNTERMYKGVALLLFSFVFVYLLLRILLTETLHDEVATYIFYFYQGDYIGENIHWDANNHLLNSFIGHQLYKVFGDNMAVLRLPNLFAFILYFFGTLKLTRSFNTPFLKITALVTLNTIPFILEYFGNARGYGLSLGFFVWALVYLINYLQKFEVKPLLLAYLFILLAVSANLTLLNSSLLFLGMSIIFPILSGQGSINLKSRHFLSHILFIIGLTPFIFFGIKLKGTGALYYGSLDGLWDVTGKTLSKYILFMEYNWLMYFFVVVFIIILFFLFQLLKRIKLVLFLKEPVTLFVTLFFGNLFAILILSNALNINYPEDRTAMYLAPLLLLIIFHLFERTEIGKWLQISLLFFPISFISHLSLHTSVFSPDDRMNDDFYSAVKKQIEPEHSIMIYQIMNWNWPYHESHSSTKSSVGLFNDPNSVLTDILITKTTILKNKEIPKLYDTIAYHEPSTYIAFKRKRPLIKVGLDTMTFNQQNTTAEYIDLGSFLCGNLAEKNLQLSISGHLKTSHPGNKILLVVETINTKNLTERYLYYSFETVYQNQIINDGFLHHFVLEKLSQQEKEIKVYLWNRGGEQVEVTKAKSILLELKTPENGSR